MAPGSPVPDAVAAELERVGRRWQQLPLDHALTAAPGLRGLAREIADALLPEAHPAIADLGPATAYDQLVVLVYDACLAGRDGELRLVDRLAEVRGRLP